MDNPFLISGYAGPDTFCDRTEEVKKLRSNVLNDINTLLLAFRRMGKSGLIQHFFQSLDGDLSIKPIYFDIFYTKNQSEFVNILATGMARSFPEKSKPGKKIMDFLKGFHPTVSFDRLSGMPEISLGYQSEQATEVSLRAMLQFLEAQDFKTMMAIDEFQQIAQYPETNTEALLQTYIQNLHNVRFIFSGSAPHVLTEMFHSAKRPFFASAQNIFLKPIESEAYLPFIRNHFERAGKSIDDDTLNWIQEFTWMHTYYVQMVCNRLFDSGIRKMTLSLAQKLIYTYLAEQEFTFSQYRNLLTSNQWELLKAIAKEEMVETPNGQAFIKRHKLGTPSHVNRSMDALLTKDLVLREESLGKPRYRVYDVLLSRWLQELRF